MTRSYQRELFWKQGRAVVHPLPALLSVYGNIWRSTVNRRAYPMNAVDYPFKNSVVSFRNNSSWS
jgi:hypothetical protein